MHFKKEGGPCSGSPIEQNSMQRLTGVPSPISGGTGWVGSRWAGFLKPPPYLACSCLATQLSKPRGQIHNAPMSNIRQELI